MNIEEQQGDADASYDESVTTGSENAASPKEAPEETSDFDIDDLIADERDDEDTSSTEVPEEKEEPVVEEAPVEKTEEPVEAEAPKEEPQKEEEPAPQEEPQTQAEPSTTPEELNAAYKEFFDKSVETLAEQVYVFDDVTKEALDTTPSEVLPKLAGQLHMQVLSAALTQVYNLFPQMLQEHQTRISAHTEAEEAFYQEYPQLKEHKQTVDRIAAIYRQANPQQKDLNTIKSEIAAMAMVQARIPLPSQQQQPPAVKPVIPTSARGGTTRAPAPSQQTQWDELVNDED